MAGESIVDELVVKLRLDTKSYKKDEKEVDKTVDRTEKKLENHARKGKKRDEETKKRTQDNAKAIRDFSEGLGKLALNVGSVLGISGGVTGILGAITALTGMETGLRKATVATGMSNREMQAWGSAARRLGADAESGAASIVALAREQKQFALTGSGPTMQALSRMGVNVGPNTSIVDMLSQAQKIYHAAPKEQQDQYEAQLTASGVGNDLIVMIKSEKDAREVYTKSLEEASTANRKALDNVSDALASLQNTTINTVSALVTILQPQIEAFAGWASNGAKKLSEFADKVIAAGGGMEGLQSTLDRDSPEIGHALHELREGVELFVQVVEVVTFGLKEIARVASGLVDWIDAKLTKWGLGKETAGHPLEAEIRAIGRGIAQAWGITVDDARRDEGRSTATLTAGAKALLATPAGQAAVGATAGVAAPASATIAAPIRLMGTTQQRARQLMGTLTSQYGLLPDQVAAVAASMYRESTFGDHQQNGTHLGVMQWDKSRRAAFRKMTGIEPDQATVQQQLDFMFSDPYEQHLMKKVWGMGGDARTLGQNFTRIYEGYGVNAEVNTRGQLAQQFAGLPAPGPGDIVPSGGNSVHISGPVTVVASNTQQLVDGINRISAVQNYHSANR